MLSHIAELVVRVADLVEAEGRDLRRVIGRLGAGLSFSMLSSGLFLGGCSLVLAGLWMLLEQKVGPAWASVTTGVIALCLGFGALKVAERYHQ
ncbi:MAG: hypothetical protein U0637_10745 [Phycisphaerales bacterium]